MNKLLASLLVNGISVYVADYFLDGVFTDSFVSILLVVIALALVNSLILPVLKLITAPLNFLSLGIFSFILNGCMVLLVDKFIDGFSVDGIFSAILFSVIVSISNTVLNKLF
jgi:putative membrane protein